MDRKCIGPCFRFLPDTSFSKGRNGSKRSVCNTCRDKQRSPEKKLALKMHNYNRKKLQRKNNPAKAIFNDSKQTDKKLGRENDLDMEFIRNLITQPCQYCSETLLRMTLDRIDNNLGHTKLNVVAACIRCNYARGNMPYGAWLFLIPGMKAAKEANAFGEWTGRFKNMTRSSGEAVSLQN